MWGPGAGRIRSIKSTRLWTATRASGREATFDESMANMGDGTPSPAQAATVLPGLASSRFDSEGLIGGTLPVLLTGFPVTSEAGGFWEMSVVPKANGTGLEQPVYIRFLQANASAVAGHARPGVLYFDTFYYIPSWCEEDALAGCVGAASFYSAMLDVHFFWERTWAQERPMTVDLPSRADTNGSLLAAQAKYALVLDMITRQESVWPRYGTVPGCVSPRGSNCSNPRRTRIACRPPSPAVTVRSHM